MKLKIETDVKSEKFLKRFKIIFVICIIFIGGFAFWYDTIYSWNKWMVEYPNIKHEKIYNGIVKDFFTQSGTAYITLDNIKFRSSSARNVNAVKGSNEDEWIDDLMEKGDSISKKENNDTIYLFKKNAVYRFYIFDYYDINDEREKNK